MRFGRSEVRGARIVRSEVTRSRVEGWRATHQKFSWISSSAAASQMVGPITSSSSSSIIMFTSSVSRGARVGCEPGKRPPANRGGRFFRASRGFCRVSFPRLRDGETDGHARRCATLRFGSAPGTRDARGGSPQGQAEGDAQASKVSGSREGPRGGRESTPQRARHQRRGLEAEHEG